MKADPTTFNPRPHWTVAELAEFLSIGRATAYRLLYSGNIRWNRVGGSLRIPIDAVQEYVKATSKGQPAAVETIQP